MLRVSARIPISEMAVPELLIELLPLTVTPFAAFISSAVARNLVWGLSAIYFCVFVVRPNLPSRQLKDLENHVEDTSHIHDMAIRELRHDPYFMAEAGLRLAQ